MPLGHGPQLKEPMLLMHWTPRKHGFLSHSLMSSKHVKPVKGNMMKRLQRRSWIVSGVRSYLSVQQDIHICSHWWCGCTYRLNMEMTNTDPCLRHRVRPVYPQDKHKGTSHCRRENWCPSRRSLHSGNRTAPHQPEWHKMSWQTIDCINTAVTFNFTCTVKVLWVLHSSESVKLKDGLTSSCRRIEGTVQMRRPAGDSAAPSGPSSSWNRIAEPSGSDAANWKTKFSPANVCRLLWGRWKDGGLFTGKQTDTWPLSSCMSWQHLWLSPPSHLLFSN